MSLIDAWQCTLLPYQAHALLVRASMTPITDKDPQARQRAIEDATRRIKREHPEFFQPEEALPDESTCCSE